MKKTLVSVKSLGLLLLCAFVTMMPALTSCQKEKTANVSDLLSTVPSSAGMVMGFNLGSLLEKAGCKVEGSSIKPGKEISELLESQNIESPKVAEVAKILLSGESGIDPVGAILFSDAYDTYITAAIADTEKFSDFVVAQTEIPFVDIEGNVKTSGNVAVSGAQMWVSLESASIDAKAVKNYSTLEATQSFISLPVSSEIATMTHDIVGYAQLGSIFKKSRSFKKAASFNLVTGFLFDNASALTMNVDFLKGELKIQGGVLSEKGKPAKYLLPASKISIEEIKRLPATCDAIVAMALTKDLVKKITKMAEPMLGGMIDSNISEGLASLNGTTAFALSSLDGVDNNLAAVISTDGNSPLGMMQLLSMMGQTQKDGKIIKVTRGEVSGSIEVAKVADKFKGATFGIIFTDNTDEAYGRQFGIASGSVMCVPEDNSLTLKIGLNTTDPDTNAILSILRSSLK